MKKLITSIAGLFLFAGISIAADTKENSASKSVQNSMAPAASSTLVSARSIAQIIEENAELRFKVEEMTVETENLNSMLDYSKMMYSTIGTLHQEELNEQQENNKNQLDYARMMNATLVNLTATLAKEK